MLGLVRLVVGLIVAGVVIISSLLLNCPAAAAQTTLSDESLAGSGDSAIVLQAWDGSRYQTVESSFVGDRVASPGARIQHTLGIINNGPSGAVMTVSLVVDQDVPPQASNPDLAQNVSLFWDVGGDTGEALFADLLAVPDGTTMVATDVLVAQGATAPVTVGFAVSPSLAMIAGGQVSADLSFDVLVQLQGAPELFPDEPPLPPPIPAPKPDTPPTASTGGRVVAGSSLLIVLLMSGAIVLVLMPWAPSRPGRLDKHR